MKHLLIERADDSGNKRVVKYDRISVVDEDGTSVDISPLVRGWNLNARAGGVEEATLYMLGVRVIENVDLLPTPDTT